MGNIKKSKSKTPVSPDNLPKKKKGHPCCFSCLTILLLILLFSGWFLIALGIFSVPVLSKVFYRPPTPSHEIIYDPSSSNLVGNALTSPDKVTDSSHIVVNEKGTGIRINEIELTSLIYKNQQKTFNKFQAAIFENNFEFYFGLHKPALIFLVNADIRFENSKLSFSVNSAQVGSFKLPKAWLARLQDFINSKITESESKRSTENDAGGAKIKSVEKHRGYLILYFEAEKPGTAEEPLPI